MTSLQNQLLGFFGVKKSNTRKKNSKPRNKSKKSTMRNLLQESNAMPNKPKKFQWANNAGYNLAYTSRNFSPESAINLKGGILTPTMTGKVLTNKNLLRSRRLNRNGRSANLYRIKAEIEANSNTFNAMVTKVEARENLNAGEKDFLIQLIAKDYVNLPNNENE